MLAFDPDERDTLRFSLTSSTSSSNGSTSSSFRIDATTGEVFVTDPTAFDYESAPRYQLVVAVTDQGGLSAAAIVEIAVVDVNEPPVFQTLRTQVQENSPEGTVVVDFASTLFAVDPEGDASINYTLLSNTTSSAVPFRIENNQLVVANGPNGLDFEIRTRYQLAIEACDSANACNSALLGVDVLDVNEAPSIYASAITVAENAASGVLVGKPLLAFDPDAGQMLVFEIVGGNDQGIFGIISCSGQLYIKRGATLDFEREEEIEIRVAVRDNGIPALSSSTLVTIAVTDVNEVPVLAIDYDIQLETRDAAALLTKESSLQGLDLVQWINAVASATVGFCSRTVTEVTSLQNTRICSSGAADPFVFKASWKMLVENDATLALRTLSQTQIRVAFVVDNVILENDVTYRPNLDLKFVDSATQYLHRGVHSIEVYGFSTSDSPSTLEIRFGDSSRSWQRVSQGALREVYPSLIVRTIAERSAPGTPVGDPVNAIDEDEYANVTYSIARQDVAGLFVIDAAAGQLSVGENPSQLDYESQSSHRVLVEVADANSNATSTVLTGQTWVLIQVEDVNEPPSVATQLTGSVLENAAGGTRIGDAIQPVDPEGVHKQFNFTIVNPPRVPIFELSSQGQLSVASGATLDFETTASYRIEIQVSDADGLSTQTVFVVTVVDVNESPSMTLEVFPLVENAPRGTVVAILTGSDPENQPLSFSYSSNLPGESSSNGDVFRIVPLTKSTAQLEVRHAIIDYEVASRFQLFLNVTDSGADKLTSSTTATVLITDVNEVPRLVSPLSDVRFSIPENSPVGFSVGRSLMDFVVDDDVGDLLAFAIVGSAPFADMFFIDQASGVIAVLNEDALDYESLQSTSLTVRVADTAGNFIDVPVVIEITDVNEPPTFPTNSVSRFVSESKQPGSVVYTASANDPERTAVVYKSIEMQPEAYLLLNETTGRLSLIKSLDPSLVYNVTVRAIDESGAGRSSVADLFIQIRVSRVNRAPDVGAFSLSVKESTAVGTRIGSVTATDSYSKSVISFSVVPSTGMISFSATSKNSADVFLWVALDFETTPRVSFQLCATDDGAANDHVDEMTGCGTLVIDVLDENEAPVIDDKSCKADRSVTEMLFISPWTCELRLF